MHKCPDCGRKIGETLPNSFAMPQHLNYMKSGPCPASGRRFVNAGMMPPPDTLRDVHEALSPRVRGHLAILGLLGAGTLRF